MSALLAWSTPLAFKTSRARVPLALGTTEPVAYALPYHLEAVPARPDLATTVLNLLNETRVAAGLAPLMPHETLQRIARAYGRELFARGTLSHVSPDGKTPRDRVVGAGIQVRVVGENLAYADDVTEAHDALMASAPHRSNILYPGYRLVGIAVLDGGSDGVIVVEDFTDDSVSYPLAKWWNSPATASTPRR
ncbi:MAG TPA: CAP domain-containing protein [bacterium]|nr:CAP domain-containing protein [bacterium]